ncbi:unnamed protein product [Albugo candida]|uniref:Uncharacterized protein n=1 Tax=Albugo candida TaxID=65357 RepID=A0A024GKM2_9STRA|nr:unnamed protein product [Albugo candida]|eukprot:CCI47318.1 unnamed protein product [Albugo candida]
MISDLTVIFGRDDRVVIEVYSVFAQCFVERSASDLTFSIGLGVVLPFEEPSASLETIYKLHYCIGLNGFYHFLILPLCRCCYLSSVRHFAFCVWSAWRSYTNYALDLNFFGLLLMCYVTMPSSMDQMVKKLTLFVGSRECPSVSTAKIDLVTKVGQHNFVHLRSRPHIFCPWVQIY